MKCFIAGCSNKIRQRREGTSFHRFPTEETIKLQWMEKIGTDVQPSRNTRLCSEHFLPSDIIALEGRRMLKATAVPQLNLGLNKETPLDLRVFQRLENRNFLEQQVKQEKEVHSDCRIEQNEVMDTDYQYDVKIEEGYNSTEDDPKWENEDIVEISLLPIEKIELSDEDSSNQTTTDSRISDKIIQIKEESNDSTSNKSCSKQSISPSSVAKETPTCSSSNKNDSSNNEKNTQSSSFSPFIVKTITVGQRKITPIQNDSNLHKMISSPNTSQSNPISVPVNKTQLPTRKQFQQIQMIQSQQISTTTRCTPNRCSVENRFSSPLPTLSESVAFFPTPLRPPLPSLPYSQSVFAINSFPKQIPSSVQSSKLTTVPAIVTPLSFPLPMDTTNMFLQQPVQDNTSISLIQPSLSAAPQGISSPLSFKLSIPVSAMNVFSQQPQPLQQKISIPSVESSIPTMPQAIAAPVYGHQQSMFLQTEKTSTEEFIHLPQFLVTSTTFIEKKIQKSDKPTPRNISPSLKSEILNFVNSKNIQNSDESIPTNSSSSLKSEILNFINSLPIDKDDEQYKLMIVRLNELLDKPVRSICHKQVEARPKGYHKKIQTDIKKSKKVIEQAIQTEEQNFEIDSEEELFRFEPKIEDSRIIKLDETKYECIVCGFLTSSKISITNHMLKHEERATLCYYCGKIFQNKITLAKHENRCIPEKCDENRKTKRNAQENLLYEKDRSTGTYKCKLCNAVFRKYYQIRVHRFTHGKRNSVCTQCNRTFYNKYDLRNHQYKHHIRFTKCEYCEKVYKHSAYLTHIKTVHNREMLYKCKKCIQIFFNKNTFEKHMKNKHSNDKIEIKKSNCVICNDEFYYKTKYQIKSHFTNKKHLEKENEWKLSNNLDKFSCHLCFNVNFDIFHDFILHSIGQHQIKVVTRMQQNINNILAMNQQRTTSTTTIVEEKEELCNNDNTNNGNEFVDNEEMNEIQHYDEITNEENELCNGNENIENKNITQNETITSEQIVENNENYDEIATAFNFSTEYIENDVLNEIHQIMNDIT